MMPLVPLAAVAAGVITTTYTIAIAREARRPRRATYAWALAHGVAPSPAEVPGVRDWHEGCTTVHPAGGTASTPDQAPPSARSIVLPWWTIRGQGSGAMLVIHGWGRSRWDSLRRVPWLLDHAASIVLPDLRGHGEAPGTTSIGHADHVDLEQVIASALPGSGDIDRGGITLVGHSMGAMVSARLAALLATRGTPARRLVLMAPYDALVVPMANRLRVRGLPAGPFAATAAWWLARGEEPLHRTLERVHCPVLALGGELDAVTTPSDVHRAAAPHGATIEPGIDHANVGVEGTASRQALNAFLTAT
jgi:pimeloyl-ACP methyl ester carboxylesterase